MSELNTADLKVLVVDDQDDARTLMVEMLGQMGVTQISESKDGKEALAFIGSNNTQVDIVICDWNMPGMTGVELLRQIRTVNEKMPFLMITGRQDMNSVVEAKNAGVTAYIGKPYTIEQLEAKIRISCLKR